MRALVYHMPKDVRVENVPDPVIEDSRDVIIKVTSSSICGSDLHIYNGMVPQWKKMVLGHEFMGIVEEAGKDVRNLKKGDRIIVPFPVACGACWFCNHSMSVHCEHTNKENYGPEGGRMSQKGAGLFGYTDLYGGYSGGQAEYVRVPYADFGPRKVPDNLTDEQVLFLTNIFPTGWSAVNWAGLQGGETVAVFGCGPVGIMAMKSAWLKGAKRVIGIDILPYRLEKAAKTAQAETINASIANPVLTLREMTGGRGADVCIDAVGMEADRTLLDKVKSTLNFEKGTMKVLNQCFSAVRRGGFVSIAGVYATQFDNFPLSQIFEKGIGLKAGQTPVHACIDELLSLVEGNKVRLDDIITHTLPLIEASWGYDIFNDKKDNCLKIVLKP